MTDEKATRTPGATIPMTAARARAEAMRQMAMIRLRIAQTQVVRARAMANRLKPQIQPKPAE